MTRRTSFTLLCCASALALFVAGCTTKAHARAEASAAFAAGQQQAMIRMQQTQAPNVTVHGTVRNPLIPWTEGMTLAQAIVAAGYYGPKTPSGIIVVRRGQAFRVDPSQLLNGNDPPLEAGDIIELQSLSTGPREMHAMPRS
ncbi:MAG TPA: hypothetical protein VMU04_10650 [Candidatus Acidoferrum sp.]|nr:hypothetical protein [Candidatus Acidoferrum sp.]